MEKEPFVTNDELATAIYDRMFGPDPLTCSQLVVFHRLASQVIRDFVVDTAHSRLTGQLSSQPSTNLTTSGAIQSARDASTSFTHFVTRSSDAAHPESLDLDLASRDPVGVLACVSRLDRLIQENPMRADFYSLVAFAGLNSQELANMLRMPLMELKAELTLAKRAVLRVDLQLT